MAGHILKLRGCTPEPLGNYLKGLGVFRLIAEQADPQARAWWKDGYLHILQSKWSRAESATVEGQLVGWLLKGCSFTPLVAPWQKGTGYLPIGKRDAGGAALAELLNSRSLGTEYFRGAFRDFATSVDISLPESASDWPETMKSANPSLPDARLLCALRNRLRSTSGLKWLDAVGLSTSRSKNDDVPKWFPILASGGGEASGQYIVNHQQRLKTALLEDQDRSQQQLKGCLFTENQIGALEAGAMGAMYFPSLMKVPNSGQGFLPDPQRRVNPWDFILLLEGTLIWSLAATKRKSVTMERAAFPFYCRGSFGGTTMIGPKEVEGAEKTIANGELWCPTWTGPCTLSEIERIFGEGRIQIDENTASRSLDFALAMSGLGIDRGIAAFHRYALLERSGSGRQTTLLAVPIGEIAPRLNLNLLLLTELRSFAASVTNNLCENGQQPRRLMNARINFERAWYAATTNQSGTEASCLDLLITAGRMMSELSANCKKPGIVKVKQGKTTVEREIPPVGPLAPTWHKAVPFANDPALRLARAIAGIPAWGERDVQSRERPVVDAIRSNLIPVVRPWTKLEWYNAKAHKGFHEASIWSRGASLTANLSAVLRRRLIDAQRGTGDGLPLWSAQGASWSDLLAYWNGDLDEARLSELIHGFALIDSGRWTQDRIDEQQACEETPDLRTSAVWFLDDEPKISLDLPQWLDEDELRDATALPRVYHLLKLCFVGGRLPRRPVERSSARRTGDEPFPPRCLDVLSLLEAGRLDDAVQLATRRLRAKGYPAVLRARDMASLDTKLDCRRLAGMMLIPVRHPGVSAALSIKPEPANS